MRAFVLAAGFAAAAVPTFAQDAMPGGAAPADARSPDYSDGADHGDMTDMHMHDTTSLGMLLLDRLEYFDARHGNGMALNAQAWYGNDDNKLWITTAGEHSEGRWHELRAEALWDRPLSAFWDTQVGVRHDLGAGPDRTWAAFGVHGLAPCWFEVDAAFYVGPSGRTALRVEAEYELLLTQKLIVQPRFEVNVFGRNDARNGIGAGLSDAALGLRLRYEFSRGFAPYIGVEAQRTFGASKDFALANGNAAFDPRIVAGLRIWF